MSLELTDSPGKPTIEELRSQLAISRNEIKNLRQQLISLTHQHKNDVESIKKLLVAVASPGNSIEGVEEGEKTKPAEKDDNEVKLKAIGQINTVFPEKRAVPRQSVLASDIQSYIEINPACFNNPEHSLEGLEDFSHLWIIYHFHKNGAHQKAKVAPPRLNGERVGVFSSRSPHRPCPIGLSLVKIDRIEENRVYFFGTDMVDQTPVFDIKPYIPQYDSPDGSPENPELVTSSLWAKEAREAPDGQETNLEANPSASSSNSQTNGTTIRVPNWIKAGTTLSVFFSDRAESQMEDLNIKNIRKTIVDLLSTDPRSVYLRTKHGSQIFTFQLGSATVTCKFDDKASTVTVRTVRRTESVNDEELAPVI